MSRLQTLTFEHDQFQRLNMGSKVPSAYSEKCPACVEFSFSNNAYKTDISDISFLYEADSLVEQC